MEKINIAEILKDCPQGMELDCTMYDNVKLIGIDKISITTHYPIKVSRGDGRTIALTKYGQYANADCAKCVIFPKGKTTWEGFVPPCEFKDGDVVVCIEDKKVTQMFILKSQTGEISGYCYTGYDFNTNTFFDAGKWYFDRLATEEEKQKLFDAIKAKGYKWNAETKTLEKLTEPNNREEIGVSLVTEPNNWELAPNKFDINTLKPFDKVLVRWGSNVWHIQFFEKYDKRLNYPFTCMNNNHYKQCIPFKGNEHLLGTTDDCDDFYKTWG